MLSSIIGKVVGAVLNGLLTYLQQRRQEAALKEWGKMEERVDAAQAKDELLGRVRDLEHRLATDPEYAERVRKHFNSPAARP